MQKSLQTNKKQRVTLGLAHRSFSVDGFTLVELLVVIAVIALLMAILLPALSKAREQGKRAVCMTQIKQLQLAWGLYADDYNEKIPCSDIWYSWNPPGGILEWGYQRTWCEWPHVWPHAPAPPGVVASGPIMQNEITNPTKDDWFHVIEEGNIWKYIKNNKIYRCPNGEKDAYVTYAIVHSMNAYPGSFGGGSATRIINRNQIKHTGERVVFIDKGYIDNGAFGILYNGDAGNGNPETRGFFDPPPIRHGMGTVLSFVDGHSEYWKWSDPRTREYKYTQPGNPDQTGNQDKYRLQKGVWGKLGYVPAVTPEY